MHLKHQEKDIKENLGWKGNCNLFLAKMAELEISWWYHNDITSFFSVITLGFRCCKFICSLLNFWFNRLVCQQERKEQKRVKRKWYSHTGQLKFFCQSSLQVRYKIPARFHSVVTLPAKFRSKIHNLPASEWIGCETDILWNGAVRTLWMVMSR